MVLAIAPKKTRADYWQYYWDQCRKLAPRTIDWDNHAYEAVLGLLMFDNKDKDEASCVIALARMGLFAPLVGCREEKRK